LSMNLFNKTYINQLLDKKESVKEIGNSTNQLILFDFLTGQ